MRLLPLALALAFLLPGCFDGDDGPGTDPGTQDATPAALEAPWWNVGESWTITFESAGRASRTTTLVNFANDTFGDPPHFWLGVSDRKEALDHVFYDSNPFLGRIHWELLAPHEKGMHAAMYEWPLEAGDRWTSPLLLGKEDVALEAFAAENGRVPIRGEARKDGATFSYDYDPRTRWFRDLVIQNADGSNHLKATVKEHKEGAKGTYWFLRGRDYLDSKGGTTGVEEAFTVKDEGATSIAFLLDVTTTGPAALEFVDPKGEVVHREAVPLGGAADKVVEVPKAPAPGTWKLRYVGSVAGEVKVRGVIEYKATL